MIPVFEATRMTHGSTVFSRFLVTHPMEKKSVRILEGSDTRKKLTPPETNIALENGWLED